MSTFDVVIVAYGNRDSMADCLDRVRALRDVGDVMVVDHGSDGSGDVAESLGARVLRDPTNPGFGAGQNRGIAATNAPYVLMLNPDATPEPDGIAAGVALLEVDPSVAAVQGEITNRATGSPERSSGRELGPVHLFGRAVGARRLLAYAPVRAIARRIGVVADHVERVPVAPVEVDWLAATAVLVRRDAFDEVGGFDESYFLYGEDGDLCRRIRRAGWTLIAMPDRFAWHDGGGSAASNADRELTWWRGTMRFAALWWTEAAWSAALLSAAIAWLHLSVRNLRMSSRAWRELVRDPYRDRATRASR